MSLSATNASGTQTSTQSPQAAGSATTGTESSSIQPGTAASSLNSSDGVPLQSGNLSVVPLGAQSSGTTQAAPKVTHHSHLLTFASVGLLILALVLFALLARDDKSTTES